MPKNFVSLLAITTHNYQKTFWIYQFYSNP